MIKFPPSTFQPRSADSFPLGRLDRNINGTFNFHENTPSTLLAVCVFMLAVIAVSLCFYCSHRLELPIKPEKLTLRTVTAPYVS